MMTIEEILDNIGETRGVNGGNPFMLTASGGIVDLTDPREDQITLNDLAHHLARINRYTGGINRENYSVAQHLILSVAIAKRVLDDEESVQRYTSEYYDQLLAVALHDGEEYAFNDLSSPVKAAIAPSKYKELAVNMRKVIYSKFGVDWAYHNACVQHADLNALVTERYLLLPASDNWPRVRKDQLFCREIPFMTVGQAEVVWRELIKDLYERRNDALVSELAEESGGIAAGSASA